MRRTRLRRKLAGTLDGCLRIGGGLRARVVESVGGSLHADGLLNRRLAAVFSGSLRTRGLMLWGATLVTGILCVSQHVYSTKLAEDIETLRTEREDLEAEIGFLQIDSARLTGRERIEEYATERLGMRYPLAHEVIRIGEGTQSRRRGLGDDLVEGERGAVSNG